MADLKLRRSVTIPLDQVKNVVYPEGTLVESIREDHRERIMANPRLVTDGRDAPADDGYDPEFGFVSFDAPSTIDDLTIEQLKEVAERNGIALRGVRRKEDILDVLRAAGLGSEG